MAGADITNYDDDLVNPHNGLAWRDLEGPIGIGITGAGRPTLTTYDDPIEEFAFAANDHYGPIKLHIPHDYAGTDMFIHTHWSHNGTNISGSLVLDYYITYAKGHGQAAFHTRKQITQTVGSLNITNTPSKQHRIDEVALSVVGGTASLLDTSIIEPDGLIIIHFDASTIPTITGGAAKPFIHYVDVHYQSNRFGTRRRAPDFYSN